MGVERMRTDLVDAGAQSHRPLPSGSPQARNWGPEVGVLRSRAEGGQCDLGFSDPCTLPHPPTSDIVETLMIIENRAGKETPTSEKVLGKLGCPLRKNLYLLPGQPVNP